MGNTLASAIHICCSRYTQLQSSASTAGLVILQTLPSYGWCLDDALQFFREQDCAACLGARDAAPLRCHCFFSLQGSEPLPCLAGRLTWQPLP